MRPANHQDLSKRPRNLYLIESMAQELSNAVPDDSKLPLQLSRGPLEVSIEVENERIRAISTTAPNDTA